MQEFSRRDLFEWSKSRVGRVEALDAPLRILADHGYIRERLVESGAKRGRPASPVFDVNPLSQKSQKSAVSLNSAISANNASQESSVNAPVDPSMRSSRDSGEDEVEILL